MMTGQTKNTEEVTDAIVKLAIKAGDAIMEIYADEKPFQIDLKDDQSPLTLADRVSHDIICEGLKFSFPDIPILSEEGADIDYDIRKNWKEYWCVDPLDGTKEFIKRNGEFTVNIALMRNNKPVLGVIYAPVLNLVYYGSPDAGSFKITNNQSLEKIAVDDRSDEWVAAGSRSHADEKDIEFLKRYPISSKIAIGSSLKFCLIAEGKAQIYFRIGPTMEWDTAAGQAIAMGAGAIMQNTDGTAFLYNKPALLNPGFVCKIK